MRICQYRRCDKDINHRHGVAKFCSVKCRNNERSWQRFDKKIIKEKFKKCIWCKKRIALRQIFCTKEHSLLYYEFKKNFREDMDNIKLKLKVSDTEKYKMIRNYLSNTI